MQWYFVYNHSRVVLLCFYEESGRNYSDHFGSSVWDCSVQIDRIIRNWHPSELPEIIHPMQPGRSSRNQQGTRQAFKRGTTRGMWHY